MVLPVAAAASAAAPIVGSIVSNIFSKKAGKKEYKRQKEFAQNSVAWRVADAERSGIHPLFAMGMQGMNYSPQSIGNDFAAAGQDVGRALSSMSTSSEKADSFTLGIQKLTLQKLGLENELLAAQIGKLNSPGSPPAMPAGSERALSAFGKIINPRADESQAQAFENEYGEWADAVGFTRLLRDAGPLIDEYIYDSLKNGISVRPGGLVDNLRQYLGSAGGVDVYR